MVYWHWEAMLISYLTSRTIALPFKTIDGLMQDTQTDIVVLPGTAQLDEFKYSPKNSVWQKAWKDRIKPKLELYPKNYEEAADFMMKNPDYTVYMTFESGQ